MRLFLVDGTVEMFRCFHATPAAKNQAGAEVGAARGVVATLAALLREPEATHLAVTFDTVRAPDKPDALGSQVPLIVDAVRALGIVVWPSGRFSADELLASGARRYRDEVNQVVLCTTDLDNAQCVVGDRVVLRNRVTKAELDEVGVRSRFGVAPKQLPDLFALVGDRSDGIAGLRGFGLKSAAALVRAFEALDAVPADPSTWPPLRGRDRLAATFARHRLETLHCRDLLMLRDDAPIPYALDDLRWVAPRPDELARIMAIIGAEPPELPSASADL